MSVAQRRVQASRAYARATAARSQDSLLEAAQPTGALVLNGATGFLREFYLKFAALQCGARLPHARL